MRQVEIKGTGSYVPPKVLKNDFFEKIGSNDAWIYSKLGIKERHVVENETTSDLAYEASKKAIEDAGIALSEIDLIIMATATPDTLVPSSACFVQSKLGLENTPAFDMSAVCTGGLYAMVTAIQFIKSGMYENILVIGADSFSKITDWDRRDSVFFGDGAGAMILSATDENKGFLEYEIFSDGKGKRAFQIPAGGSEMPTSQETLKKGLHYFQMDGKAVFDTATKVLPETIQNTLRRSDVSVDEIRMLVPHQPSIRILQSTAGQIGLPFEKVFTNMDKYANTSGATIPIALDEARKQHDFKSGDHIVFAAVGAGWTWGSALYQF